MNVLVRILSALLSVLFLIITAPQLLTLNGLVKDFTEARHALEHPWPQTSAEMVGDFKLAQVKSAQAVHLPGLVYYPVAYRYSVNGKNCAGSRFDFSSKKTLGEIKPSDGRIHNFLRTHCVASGTETSPQADLYHYTCRRFQIFYKPDNVCSSYIANGVDPQNDLDVLGGRIKLVLRMVGFNLAMAAVGLIIFMRALNKSTAR